VTPVNLEENPLQDLKVRVLLETLILLTQHLENLL
jgi:hypothetical protein